MRFDEKFLREVGLSAMSDEDKTLFLEYIEGELEYRIGEKISEGIPDDELLKFEQMDDVDALLWLKENKPNFTEIVENTINELKEEISSKRNEILEA